jgi:hypothetical protein
MINNACQCLVLKENLYAKNVIVSFFLALLEGKCGSNLSLVKGRAVAG